MRTGCLVLLGALLALVFPAAAAAQLDDAGYLHLADRLQPRMDRFWNAESQRYLPRGSGTDTLTNANLLLVHAVAARAGHAGPSRQDERARAIARHLVAGPVWVERIPRGATGHGHAPGWVTGPGSHVQHLVFDAEVVDALAHAYRARHALALPESTVGLIQDRIRRLVRGRYWRPGTLRLNQFNWYLLAYAADATVNGNRRPLARQAGRHIARFVRGVHATPRSDAGNLGPGLRFHYIPHGPRGIRMNVDSAEYANIVMSFARFYDQARAAGMRAITHGERTLLRSWARRVITGYWTHAGYLNWDSGLGFDRWHQAKKLGLAQQALIGLASARGLQPSQAYGRYAKHLLDRGLLWYADQADRTAPGLPPGVLFGVHKVPQSLASARMAASRIAANAARALDAGLGRLPGAAPPSMYSYDPDTGRLAVTTPRYNTAIVAVTQGAFPYGGIDLARLYDARQEVAGTTGGLPPASFGVVVRDRAGRTRFATQTPRRVLPRRRAHLRLTRAPRGVGASLTRVGSAYGGGFSDLRAGGRLALRGYRARTAYRFLPERIEARWTVRRGGHAPVSADARFPSWGRRASVALVGTNGAELPVTGDRVGLAGVDHLAVRSAHGASYRVTPGRLTGVTARILRSRPQAAAPRPGPTLVLEFADRSRAGSLRFAAQIEVDP